MPLVSGRLNLFFYNSPLNINGYIIEKFMFIPMQKRLEYKNKIFLEH